MMVRTAAQYSRIAAVYERAAADDTLPPQPRVAFAKKASWFRMLAQIEAAKQAAVLSATPDPTGNMRNGPKFAPGKENLARMSSSNGPTLAERLSRPGVVRGVSPVGFLTRDILSRNRVADGATPGIFAVETTIEPSLTGQGVFGCNSRSRTWRKPDVI